MTTADTEVASMTRVLLAEDHAMVRSGIRALLESVNMEVVGEASDGHEALRLAGETSPDVVLLDVAMPRLNGIEAARQIMEAHPKCKIIMLSMHADEQYVYEALRAGVNGYVVKDAAFGELVTAIRTVLSGRNYLSPSLADLVTTDYIRRARGQDVPSELDKLSNRQRQVLQLIAEGHSSAEAAKILHISVRTVEAHRFHLMEKLGLHNIAEVTKFAVRHGICSA
jgi:DNA-binding NarL/FixJ family response regulator